jgi:hypothetical protein
MNKSKGYPKFETFGSKKIKKRRKVIGKDKMLDLTQNNRYADISGELSLTNTENSLPPLDRSSKASSIISDSDYDDNNRSRGRSSKWKRKHRMSQSKEPTRNKKEEWNQSLTYTNDWLGKGNSFIGSEKKSDRSKSLRKSNSKRKQDLTKNELRAVNLKQSLKNLKSKPPPLERSESRSISNASRDNSWKNRYIRKTQSINSLKLL